MDGMTLFTRTITLIAIVMTFSIPIWAIFNDHRKRRMLHEERRLMIERGMVPPPLPAARKPWDGASDPVRALEACFQRGVILTIVGVGMAAGLLLLTDQLTPFRNEVPDRTFAELSVVALFIGLIGVANLAYYALARRRVPAK